MPTISPAPTRKEMSLKTPLRLRPRTSSNVSRGPGWGTRLHSAWARPTMAATSSGSVNSPAGREPTTSPSRSTVIRSEIANTSSSR